MRLQHLAPRSLERLLLVNHNTSRVLLCTMALFEIVIPSFELIHDGLVGNHSSRNVLTRVVKIVASWSGSRMGVAQGMKLTSSGCESEG
jgi:hypothetical protein